MPGSIDVRHIQPLGIVARTGNLVLTPVMYLASGTFSEAPQQGHAFNLSKLTRRDEVGLDNALMIHYDALPGEIPRTLTGIRTHIPILGGWRDYIVLAPTERIYRNTWYIGWIAGDGAKDVSRLPIYHRVRVLRGPMRVKYFGVDGMGKQIVMHEVGRGRIGDGGAYAQDPLR